MTPQCMSLAQAVGYLVLVGMTGFLGAVAGFVCVVLWADREASRSGGGRV